MVRALFGGSFDPVHRGHTAMVDHVLGAGLAAMVHVVPAWQSPFKNRTTATPAQRLQMAHLAWAGRSRVVVENLEIEQGVPCYAIDTLVALQSAHPADQWRLVIGADNVSDFRRWHRSDDLQKLAEIVVLGRSNLDISADALRDAGLDASRFLTRPEFSAPVSSTSVRAMLASGPGTAAELVASGISDRVAAYIVAQKLYSPAANGEDLVPDSD